MNYETYQKIQNESTKEFDKNYERLKREILTRKRPDVVFVARQEHAEVRALCNARLRKADLKSTVHGRKPNHSIIAESRLCDNRYLRRLQWDAFKSSYGVRA
jgi:hypothetical protein